MGEEPNFAKAMDKLWGSLPEDVNIGFDYYDPKDVGYPGLQAVEGRSIPCMDENGIMHEDLFNILCGEFLPYQERVMNWMRVCFTQDVWDNATERNFRFFEEAAELVQARGLTRELAHRLVDYVYDRPVGEPYQEVGGVMVTLASLCEVAELDMQECAELELDRINQPEIIEKVRSKQKAKPRDIAV